MSILLAAEPDPDPALASALERILGTSTCPKYLRDAATPWLATKETT